MKRINRLRRNGAATVELALLLPFLCFLFAIAVDYARLFYFAITLENCARNGAYYASNYPNNNYIYNDIYGYTSLEDAILRDAGNLSPAPTYEVKYSWWPEGPFWLNSEPSWGGYVRVKAKWTFTSLTKFPGVPTTVNLERFAVMEVAPAMPQFN